MTINLSEFKPYYSQRNNQRNAMIACQVTSAISALVSSEIPFVWDKSFSQPEDYLDSLFDAQEAKDMLKNKYPELYKQGYRPQEVHAILQWGINKIVGRDVDVFRTDVSIQEIVWQIVRNRKAIVMSTKLTASGHVVPLVGLILKDEYTKDINNWKSFTDIPKDIVEGYIIDDPFGNYKTGYKSKDGIDGANGNDIVVSPEDFMALFKNVNSGKKFAHMFKSE